MHRDQDRDITKNLYSIGEMNAVTGLSVSTIRYYDELGIIKPSYVDENTGYRYFSSQHVWKLEIIKLYKKLGFSLEEIRTLQSCQESTLFLSLINKNKERIRRQVEQLKVTLSDLDWMEEQCKNICAIHDTDSLSVKNLPERKVIFAQAVDPTDTKDLQMRLQKKASGELKEQFSIRRGYGYILNQARFESGQVAFDGEYILLDSYLTCQERDLKVLPAGKYLCMKVKMRDKNSDWMQKVRETITALNITPRMVIANEVSLYLFKVEDTLYELQILF